MELKIAAFHRYSLSGRRTVLLLLTDRLGVACIFKGEQNGTER